MEWGCYCRTKLPCPIHGAARPVVPLFTVTIQLAARPRQPRVQMTARRPLCLHLGRHLFDAAGERRWAAPT